MTHWLAVLAVVVIAGCADDLIRDGSRDDYMKIITSDRDTVDEGNGNVIITAYRTEVLSVDGKPRRKEVVARIRISKQVKDECDKRWYAELEKNTIPVK